MKFQSVMAYSTTKAKLPSDFGIESQVSQTTVVEKEIEKPKAVRKPAKKPKRTPKTTKTRKPVKKTIKKKTRKVKKRVLPWKSQA